jgi:prepilin-type N-terminal cleavage/methylation domain-containing protein
MKGGQADRRAGGRTLGRAGFTLVEMLVVLAILGVLAGVSVSALPSLRASTTPLLVDRLAAARRSAISSGIAVTITAPAPTTGEPRSWRFYSDGRAVGPGVDPRNGRVVDAALAVERRP